MAKPTYNELVKALEGINEALDYASMTEYDRDMYSEEISRAEDVLERIKDQEANEKLFVLIEDGKVCSLFAGVYSTIELAKKAAEKHLRYYTICEVEIDNHFKGPFTIVVDESNTGF